jgi:chitosanase
MSYSRRIVLAALAGILAGVSAACAQTNNPVTALTKAGTTAAGGLSPEQKHRAEQLTSVFENDKLEFQYGYVEELGDGRGITAGRVGFTTGTGDACDVVKRYTAVVPDNPLARFLPELVRLNTAEKKGDTSHLKGFRRAWKQAAKDPKFCHVQDEVTDEMYYAPAVKHAAEAGAHTVLAIAAIYDAEIQHGDGDDPDGVPALLKATEKAAGGTPKTGVDEKTWLHTFLTTRRADLAHSVDESTRQAWAESVDRVDVFLAIEREGNYDLHGPMHINSRDFKKTIP